MNNVEIYITKRKYTDLARLDLLNKDFHFIIDLDLARPFLTYEIGKLEDYITNFSNMGYTIIVYYPKQAELTDFLPHKGIYPDVYDFVISLS